MPKQRLRHLNCRSSQVVLSALLALVCCSMAGCEHRGASSEPGFAGVYELLSTHCGACHVQGLADGPWSLNTPPSAERFQQCLALPAAEQNRCATWRALVDVPAPGIPAWIRPEEASASEPYAQACDESVSFHIGHSLPAALPAADCSRFLRWIESGAAY